MTGETTRDNTPEDDNGTGEQRRFPRLRRAGVRVARIAVLAAGIAYFTGDRVDNPSQEPAAATSTATTDLGYLDFRYTLDEDVAECHELRPLDTCIAGNFGSSETPSPSQVDVPYTADDEYRAEIAECRERMQPLDDCIASNF